MVQSEEILSLDIPVTSRLEPTGTVCPSDGDVIFTNAFTYWNGSTVEKDEKKIKSAGNNVIGLINIGMPIIPYLGR